MIKLDETCLKCKFPRTDNHDLLQHIKSAL